MRQKDIPDILRIPDRVEIETEGTERIEFPGNEITVFRDIKVSVEKRKNTIRIFLQADRTPVRRVRLSWKGRFSENDRILGDHWERGYGDLEWKKPEKDRILPWYFLAHSGHMTVGYGVKVRPSAFCSWKTDEHELSLCLDVRCGGQGVILDGRRLEAAEAVMLLGGEKTAFETAEELCRIMSPAPLKCTEPVYGGNNWYYAYGDSSESEILKDAEYISGLAAGLKNRPYMVIDDGWQSNHRNNYNGGPWEYGNEKFPDMKSLAEKMKACGVRPGIWLRLLQNEDENIPEIWRLQRDGQFLDPSVPDVRAWVKETVRRLKEWGYLLVKHDFSTWDMFGTWGFQMGSRITADGWHFADRSRTGAEIVKDFYSSILEASDGMLILGCNCIGHLGAGLMHINRTGDDTSGLEWERTRKMGVNTLAFRMPQHGHFFEADADCVGITEKIPWEKNRQWLELLSVSGTPLFVSVRPGSLSEKQEEDIRLAFERASCRQERAVPLDWMTNLCPERWQAGNRPVQYQWENG